MAEMPQKAAVSWSVSNNSDKTSIKRSTTTAAQQRTTARSTADLVAIDINLVEVHIGVLLGPCLQLGCNLDAGAALHN